MSSLHLYLCHSVLVLTVYIPHLFESFEASTHKQHRRLLNENVLGTTERERLCLAGGDLIRVVSRFTVEYRSPRVTARRGAVLVERERGREGGRSHTNVSLRKQFICI